MPGDLAVGDRVHFVLAVDIPAIVVDVVTSGVGYEYQVAWFDNSGIRQTGYVKRCEVRKLFAKKEAGQNGATENP